MAALSMRRLEERNVLFAVSGAGDTIGIGSLVVERYDKAASPP